MVKTVCARTLTHPNTITITQETNPCFCFSYLPYLDSECHGCWPSRHWARHSAKCLLWTSASHGEAFRQMCSPDRAFFAVSEVSYPGKHLFLLLRHGWSTGPAFRFCHGRESPGLSFFTGQLDCQSDRLALKPSLGWQQVPFERTRFERHLRNSWGILWIGKELVYLLLWFKI